MKIFMPGKTINKVKHTPNTKFDFIDRAAAGELEAAAMLAEGYLKGKYECEVNVEKARKWASYAAKRGNELGFRILREIDAKN
ncbi:MAG: hypothetical protein UHN88_03795 [Eubacterium sp.]|nr:hypothetical protein [Eubacterium sp.]